MHEDSNMPEWLTVREVATLFECHRAVIYAYIRRGVLTARYSGCDAPAGEHFNLRCQVSRDAALSLLEQRRPCLQQGEWFSQSEAARYLGLSISAVKKRIASGGLHPVSWLEIPVEQRTRRDRSSRVYLSRSDLDGFRNRRRVERFLDLPTHHAATDLAYAAGLMDGEGCVSILPTPRGRGYYVVTVCIVNTYQPAMLWLKDTLGGGLYHRTAEQAHYRDQWNWRLQSGRAYQFLRLVMPYLQIKRNQAHLAVEFYERLIAYAAGRDRLLSEEEITWRQECITKLHRLNAGSSPKTE